MWIHLQWIHSVARVQRINMKAHEQLVHSLAYVEWIHSVAMHSGYTVWFM